MVVASPVYYASANGTLIALLDRLFYSSSFDKSMKVGASVAVARRGGISSTFTVRRITYGCGVEKTFPLHSPNVVKVDVIRRGKVRRAKLYYLRGRVGKASKVKEDISAKN